jgi:hypothetical protein
MGMDIYGLNPKLTSERPEIDWDTSTEESRKEYFKVLEEWEEENPGYYFRANLWSWRPIHALIDSVILLNELDLDTKLFGENSGGGFKTQEECDLVANGLKDLVAEMKESGQETIYLNLGMWVSWEGSFNVPQDLQAELNEQNEKLFIPSPIVASNGQLVIPAHGVSIEHIETFINFLYHCGGFEIW